MIIVRRLAILIAITALLAGCARGQKPAPREEISSNPREIGRPWPVLAGEFRGGLAIVSHDEQKCIFTVTGREQQSYSLDYQRRRLRLLTGHPEAWRWAKGTAQPQKSAGRDQLYLIWPDGKKIRIDRGELLETQTGYVQTVDQSTVYFYEISGDEALLVSYNQDTEERRVWRQLPLMPEKVGLTLSPDGSYLAEAVDDQIFLHNLAMQTTLSPVAGNGPVFSPGGRFLAYWRPDGLPAIFDPQSGATWALFATPRDYRPLPTIIWSPDEGRLFLQAAATAEAPQTAAPFLLLMYTVSSGAVDRFDLTSPFDVGRYAVILQSARPDVGRLLDLVRKFQNGPLVAFGDDGYLAGRGKTLIYLDNKARQYELQTFPAPIIDLSLDARRLLILTTFQGRTSIYTWLLPPMDILMHPFPETRDLRLGDLVLDETEQEVQKKLGRPLEKQERIDPRDEQRRLTTWRFAEVKVDLAGGRLVRIICSAPGFFTGRGIEVGATQADVFQCYGRPDYQTENYLSYQGEAAGKDIKVAFNLDRDNKVAAILVSLVEPD